MSEDLEILEGGVDQELITLVDEYLDGDLSEEGKNRLEQRLETEESAQDYFVERVQFHAEMLESNMPVRIEVTQKRQVVFEYESGLPKVSVKQVEVAKIGNPESGNFVELEPEGGVSARPLAIWALGLICLTVVSVIAYHMSRETVVAEPVLELRNGSFEATDLTEDEDGFSYSLLDWQDHFSSSLAGVCDPKKIQANEVTAPEKSQLGSNVALMRPRSFLTQRLRYSDGSALKAKKGLKLRLKGWIFKKDNEPTDGLRVAIRVVYSVHPEMLQYEPSKVMIKQEGGNWQTFSVELTLPSKSLSLHPSDGNGEVLSKGVLDVTGKDLTLSIDNRTEATYYLDGLSVELVE